MRMLYACVVALAIGCGGSGDDEKEPSTDAYDCQPLCQDASGNILGANNDLDIDADDQTDAEDQCLSTAKGSAGTCPTGQTVVRCSCELKSDE